VLLIYFSPVQALLRLDNTQQKTSFFSSFQASLLTCMKTLQNSFFFCDCAALTGTIVSFENVNSLSAVYS